MARHTKEFLAEHEAITRRWFVKAGGIGVAAIHLPTLADDERPPQLQAAIEGIEPFITSQDDFRDVSRGKPKPHQLPADEKEKVGLSRDTWKLDVTTDPDHPARIRNEFSQEKNSAFMFRDLMNLASDHAVRFPKVMTCLNIGCPLGMGIWEGVPLREVLWLTQPRENLRRVYYYGFHNDDPKQMFRSSLPVGRVLEDLYDLPPVILCYKLNGEWLTSERGGPVRIVVPEAYGFKSIKWLSNIVLSNLSNSNDTYGEKNNDVDSPLKTFAATLSVPTEVKANTPFPLTGYAQVGVSGLSKVQVWLQNEDEELPGGDKYYVKAPWSDTTILKPPAQWGNTPSTAKIPKDTFGFDDQTPKSWPMRLTKVHWAFLHPGLQSGEYSLRSRTIDNQGQGQPMPRPFRKSGHSAIETVSLTVV